MSRYVYGWCQYWCAVLCFALGIAGALMKRGAMLTVLHSLLTALAWPVTLLAATEFIDSTWTIAIDRLLLSVHTVYTTFLFITE